MGGSLSLQKTGGFVKNFKIVIFIVICLLMPSSAHFWVISEAFKAGKHQKWLLSSFDKTIRRYTILSSLCSSVSALECNRFMAVLCSRVNDTPMETMAECQRRWVSKGYQKIDLPLKMPKLSEHCVQSLTFAAKLWLRVGRSGDPLLIDLRSLRFSISFDAQTPPKIVIRIAFIAFLQKI